MQQLTSTFHRIVLTLPFPSILAVFSISIHCQEQTFLLTPSLSMSLSLSVSFLLAPLAACVCLFTGSIQTRTQTFHGSINLLPSVAETLRKIHWENARSVQKGKKKLSVAPVQQLLCLRHATCHLPPATSRPQTPDSPHPATPCPNLPWLVVHTSKCCATYAMYNFVPQFPLGHLSHSHSPPSFLSPHYLILFFSHSQVSLAHAFRLSSCHAHRIFSYIFFGLLVLNYPSTLFTHTYTHIQHVQDARMRGNYCGKCGK